MVEGPFIYRAGVREEMSQKRGPLANIAITETFSCVRVKNPKLGDSILSLGAGLAAREKFECSLSYRGKFWQLFREWSEIRDAIPGDESRFILQEGGSEWIADPDATIPVWMPMKPKGWQVLEALPWRWRAAFDCSLDIASPLPPLKRPNAKYNPKLVVFISATSRPEDKDWMPSAFLSCAEHIAKLRSDIDVCFVTGLSQQGPPVPMLPVVNAPAHELLDLFASSRLVIGNDTGLMHLATLCESPGGKAPIVLSLNARHSPARWSTGRRNHFGLATPFTRMLTEDDKCPVRDRLEPIRFGSTMNFFAPRVVAEIAAKLAW